MMEVLDQIEIKTMIWWIHETILKQKGTEKLKGWGEKMNHPNTNYKARVAILLLVKVDCKAKSITKDNEK